MFVDELRELVSNADANADNADETQKTDLCLKWEEHYLPSMKSELTKRAARGNTDAYINFDRNLFSNTGLGRPSEMLELFLSELQDPDSKRCQNKGFLQGITVEVWNNTKFTVKFSWSA